MSRPDRPESAALSQILRGENRVCLCGARLAADNKGNQCWACARAAREATRPPIVSSEFWEDSRYDEGFRTRHIGKIVRAFRTDPRHRAGKGGYSQEKVGEWLGGLAQAQVSRLESSSRPETELEKLNRYAKVFDIPPYLLWFDLPDSGPSVEDIPETTQEIKLKSVLRERGLLNYRLFCRAFEKAAANLDLPERVSAQSERQFYRWLSGGTLTKPYPLRCAILEKLLSGWSADDLFALAEKQDSTAALSVDYIAETASTVFDNAESLRINLTSTLAATVMSDAGIDDLEQIVFQLGKATRFRPASSLLSDLTSNIGDVHRLIGHTRSQALSRRLIRIAAQMSGLMSLTLLKLDDKDGSLNWTRTARLLAAETGNPELRSWVQAQEAYFYFYDKNLVSTIDAARHAQALASGRPGVGSALAAAIEARAYALLDRKQDARRAAGNAESYLERLGNGSTIPSAFGYNEAQLRFHQGSMLTQLRETKAAFAVQDRALELCPPDDYMDRSLVLLDRADCLVADKETSSAIELTTQIIVGLRPSEAQGLISNRAREILQCLPPGETRRHEALELCDAIESLSGDEKEL